MQAIKVGEVRRCPHCGVRVQFIYAPVEVEAFRSPVYSSSSALQITVGGTAESTVKISVARCPQCRRAVLALRTLDDESGQWYPIWPRAALRGPVPEEVPDEIRNDFVEANLVLSMSPNASAALSRRCLQNLLVEKGGAPAKENLSHQIEHVLPNLPPYLVEDLDAIRNLGNFAAHPMKSQSTGQIVPVEEGEAEWSLVVIEALFDFYYVEPKKAEQRRAALDAKLTDAGKPRMKRPSS